MLHTLPVTASKVKFQSNTLQRLNSQSSGLSFNGSLNLQKMPVSFGSLELEDKAMRNIGLGNHYHWYNGSGSCYHIRTKAADLLQGTIQELADAGEEIIPPDERIIEVVKNIAHKSSTSDYSLTETWHAASDAIRIHMDAYSKQADQREEYIQMSVNALIDRYINPKNSNDDQGVYLNCTDMIAEPESILDMVYEYLFHKKKK